MNLTYVKTGDYEDKRLCRRRQNKPNSNPISKAKNDIICSAGLVFFFAANMPDEERLDMQVLALIISSYFKFSSDNRCCCNRFLNITVLNCHRNLNALNIF